MKPEVIEVECSEDLELEIKTENKVLIERIRDKYRNSERVEVFGCLWVIVQIEDNYSPVHSFSALLLSESSSPAETKK